MNLKILSTTLLSILFLALLVVSIRGRHIDLIDSQTIKNTAVAGPYEASNSNARFALTEAIMKNHSLFLTREQAGFGAPDITLFRGRYFPVFTPGVSFLGIPFYWIGQQFGYPQIGAYLLNMVLGVLNVALVARLAKKLGASRYGAILSGIIFLFATNALAYSTTYTQHHGSTFVVLSSMLIAVGRISLIRNLTLGGLFGLGLMIDIPTGLMLVPIMMYVLWKHATIISLEHKIKISLKYVILGIALGLLPMAGVFGWYNYQTTGSYSTLAQSIGRVEKFESEESVESDSEREDTEFRLSLPYSPRKIINGLYILIISNERGWFYYSPVMAIGLLGLGLGLKKPETYPVSLVGLWIISLIVVSYAMFGDPWGGWSFGPRYLIPASGIASIFIGLAINKFRCSLIFLLVFLGLSFYSVYLSSLGALTTNVVPPKVEAVFFANPIPYTPEYNWQLIDKNVSSSLVYNLRLQPYLSAKLFLIIFIVAASGLISGLYLMETGWLKAGLGRLNWITTKYKLTKLSMKSPQSDLESTNS